MPIFSGFFGKGNTPPKGAVNIGGTDSNGNFVGVGADSAGSFLVSTQGMKATYRAVYENTAFAANGQAVWQMSCSGTKLVRITRLRVQGQLTTAGLVRYQLQKLSTLNTGGTPAAVTAFPIDSKDVATTCTVQAYTVAPTVGTVVGTLSSNVILLTAPATVQDQDVKEYDFAKYPGAKPLTLNSSTEGITLIQQPGAVNLAGLFLIIEAEWTEE